MAQNVTIAGASYEDVPSVDMPTTGGGTSSFYDVSDTTATAADVASGKVFYSAAGVRSTGTASGGSGVSVFYGTCATAAATAAKVVVCEEFTSADLVEGTVINVEFTNAQLYNGAPALNVNSTGAHNIKRAGATNAARYEWQAGEVLQFVYNGAYWCIVDGGLATTTYYGVTKLSSATNSTSNALAATASAVKAAYDLANGKQDALVSGTNIKTINGDSILGNGDLAVGGGSTVEVTQTLTSGTEIASVSVDGTNTTLYAPTPPTVPSASSTTPSMDGTAAVGTATTYARADHVHPTDTSRQATLVSGTNIKTINNQSLLGSGNITISGGGGGSSWTDISSEFLNAQQDVSVEPTVLKAYTNGTFVYVTFDGLLGDYVLMTPSGYYPAHNACGVALDMNTVAPCFCYADSGRYSIEVDPNVAEGYVMLTIIYPIA